MLIHPIHARRQAQSNHMKHSNFHTRAVWNTAGGSIAQAPAERKLQELFLQQKFSRIAAAATMLGSCQVLTQLLSILHSLLWNTPIKVHNNFENMLVGLKIFYPHCECNCFGEVYWHVPLFIIWINFAEIFCNPCMYCMLWSRSGSIWIPMYCGVLCMSCLYPVFHSNFLQMYTQGFCQPLTDDPVIISTSSRVLLVF